MPIQSPASQTRDLDADLELAGRLADAAWQMTRLQFRNLSYVTDKSRAEDAPQGGAIDPVTEADRAAEQAIRSILEAERPADGIIGEEFDAQPSDTGWSWVIDPVDGTRAFVAGLPLWTTLIALCDKEGTPVIGVIDQPVLGERYLGWPGAAALVSNGARTPLHVSAKTDLREAVIATTDPFILTPSEQGAWMHLRHTASIVRYGLDAYAYARLAAGSIDLVAESGLAAWDAAALIPIVRGAGGLACDWTGKPAKPGGQLVCAASQEILDQALISLRRSASEGAIAASYPKT